VPVVIAAPRVELGLRIWGDLWSVAIEEVMGVVVGGGAVSEWWAGLEGACAKWMFESEVSIKS
jgi:hypothetical protein